MAEPTTTTTTTPAPSPLPIEQQIAAHVVQLLNAQTFSQAFLAERKYLAKALLEHTTDLVVTVMAVTKSRERSSRITNEDEIGIAVAVQQKINPADAAQGDELSYLVQEITDWLDDNWSMDIDGAGVFLIGVESNPLWQEEHLLSLRQFTNVTTHTFKVERERNPQ